MLGTSRAVRYEDRERLPYTRAVLHEVQRLSSVVTAGAVRQCVTSTRVHGHPVPKVGGPSVTSCPIQCLQKAPFAGLPAQHSHLLQLLPVCQLSVNHPSIHPFISIYVIPDGEL